MASASRTIFILAGPTGGHLFPAWAFAESLKRKRPDWRLCLLTGERAKSLGQEFQSSPFDAVYYAADFHGMARNPLKALLNAAKAGWQTWQWFGREKPALAAGFGSYASVPGVLLAAIRRIPVLLHEQNKIAGKATRFLMRFSRLLAASFEETEPAPQPPGSWQVVGLPIRQKLLEKARNFERDFDSPRLTWLVVGGSQGSRRINQVVMQTLKRLSPEECEKIAVILITGRQDFEKIAAECRELKIPIQVHPFFDKMHELFSQADFALTRAGANTLFELALFGVPAAVVPYPYAGAHQKDNAVAFEKRGALVLQKESSLSSDLLHRMIQIFLADRELRQRLSRSIRNLAKPDAGDELAERACALLEAL